MQVEIASFDPQGLCLAAPLAPNSNHKRTAFGGSIHGLCTLACWGLLWLLLENEADAHVVIHASDMRYHKPVDGILRARAPLPDDETIARFLDTFARRGRARITLHAHLGDAEHPAASFEGRFVAMRGQGG
jgi:thioesterase domain-containing protein